jgi:nicotinic acid mononucleotide adenylyltransferase
VASSRVMPLGDDERRAVALARLRDADEVAAMTDVIRTHATAAAPLAVVAGEARLRAARRVGVLAGSFNPPTWAHVALADSARTHGGLDAVLWVISRVTVDKEAVARAPLAARLVALAALTDAGPHDAAGLIAGGLYADQARMLRAALPALADLAFIVGYDKIVQIFDPHYYADRDAALHLLFTNARILVAPRGAGDAAALGALLAAPENRPWADRVRGIPLDVRWRGMASSAVRGRIDAGLAIADLVPPEGEALVAAGAYRAV